MSFQALDEATEKLRKSLKTSTGRDLIARVSLEFPSDDTTEISFHKAIMWGYVFWLEACQPAGRHLLNIVRNTSPADHKLISRAFTDLQNLRASKAHNLDPTSTGDRYKLEQAKLWLLENGGEPPDWQACNRSLSYSLTSAVTILVSKWNEIVLSDEDAKIAICELLRAIDREWPAYLFDRIVENAAECLSLTGFDAVTYRKTRLQDWRSLTEVFSDRKSAEAAIGRAILQELTLKFGIPREE